MGPDRAPIFLDTAYVNALVNTRDQRHDAAVQWEQKLAAIRCYESQFITGRPTQPTTFLEGLRDEAAYWGKTIGANYGEPFACREPLGLSTMAGLV